jgi:DNA invertase Pin-like site-specific DNA recombinase
MTATATRTLRAAVYLRISDDRLGQEAGVEQQDHVTTEYLDREGWERVLDGDAPYFVDNDISAFDGKVRPAYERLLDAVRRGDVDVVLARHPERLHRNMTELDAWISLTAGRDVPVYTVKEGLWNLSTPGGRLIARQLGSIAVYESEHKRDRIRDRMKRNAELGKMHGALRTYGMEATRHENGTHSFRIVDDEAAVIVEAVDRLLAGETLLGVTRDLNARGILTLRGKTWSRQSLRNLVLSARICGWREHTPGRTDSYSWSGGTFVAEGEWPAIVERSKVERLRRMLGDPSRQRGKAGSAYLLSGGLVRCGLCGENLRGHSNHGTRAYQCVSKKGVGKGCGGVTIRAEALEEDVRETVRSVLADGTLSEELRALAASSGADDAWAAVVALREEQDALAADAGAGRITRSQFHAWNDPLVARLAAAERDLERRQEQESAALLVGGLSKWDDDWAAAEGDLGKRRALLSAVLVSVEIGKASKAGRAFDASRITYGWRV